MAFLVAMVMPVDTCMFVVIVLQIVAACDFYMYIGHIERGIVKAEGKTTHHTQITADFPVYSSMKCIVSAHGCLLIAL